MRPEEDDEDTSDSSSEADLSKAFEELHLALRCNPSKKADKKQEFLCLMAQLCAQLTVEENYLKLLDHYHQALTLFPNSEEILYNFGALLLRLGHPKESSLYLRRALESCPDYLPAHNALLSVRNYLVERWHFRMLNDHTRNEAFRTSISSRVTQGHNTVLDIGSGTGILSIFATEAGAKEVWACDASETMVEMATEIVAANGASKKIHLINKMSMDLGIPDDVPQRVSLVVTETFDAALIGEGVLLALQHAWRELLLPSPEGVVVPQSGAIWVALVECADISRKFALRSWNTTNAGEGDSKSLLLKMPNLNVTSEMIDPYDTENLQRVAGGFRLLSKPVKVLTVDFNNLEDIERCLNNEGTIIPTSFDKSGRFDAVVAWFDLVMDDKQGVLSTRPFQGDDSPSEDMHASCWEQAIFHQRIPATFEGGHSVKLCVSSKDSRLDIHVLNEDDKVEKGLIIPQKAIRFLNDTRWVEEFCKTADELFELWMTADINPTEILDLSPFPVLGLKFLSRVGKNGNWFLTCVNYCSDYVRFVRAVAKENGIPEERIHFVDENKLPAKMFKLIVWHFFDSKGELDEDAISQYPQIRSHLASDGLIIPQNITVKCELIESEYLYKCARVENDSRQIANFINIYEVKHHLDLNLESLDATPLSKETEVLRLQVDQLGPGGLFSEQKRSICAKIDRNGTVHAVAYWFLIELMSNSGRLLSTLGASSHILQAAVLASPPVPVRIGQSIKLAAPYHYGLLQIEIMEND